MTTLDHAVEEECRRILLEEGREGGGRPVMADIRNQIIPAIEQKQKQNADNWFRCTEQTYK
jgi:hypothetical protein